jgi:DNA-binding transcriptional ArsR family regulator
MQVHKSNREIANKIASLLDEKGRAALDEKQCKLLEIIGRFDREEGNFMSPKSILGLFSGRRMSLRTLRRHLRYLSEQGIVSATYRDDGRMVWRLEEPPTTVIESLASYRSRLGMSEYAYRDRRTTMNNPKSSSFLPLENDKFCLSGPTNFAFPYKDDVRINDSKRLHHPPLSPLAPLQSQPVGPSAPDAGANRRPHERGSRRDPRGGIHLPDAGEITEPINRGKGRKSMTQVERAEEAARLIAKGHIVNPLGKPNMSGRKLKPGLAAEIDPDSNAAVTIPQLYRSYVATYDAAYGMPGLLEEIMPATREFMENFVGRLKQAFYEVSGYTPTTREIWEYIKWFHEPEMLSQIRKHSNRIPNHPGVAHPNQLLGKIYVKTFYDRNLANRNPRSLDSMSKGEIDARMAHKVVEEAYDALRNAGDSDFDLVLCLVNYGFVIFGEYLRDVRDLGPSESKKYIISLMARYLHKASDKSSASRYLEQSYPTTEKHPIQDSTLWKDWKVEMNNAINVALEMSMKMGVHA